MYHKRKPSKNKTSKGIDIWALSARSLEEKRLENLKRFNKDNVIYFFKKELREKRNNFEPEKENKLRVRDFSDQVRYNLNNLIKHEIDTLFYYFQKHDDNYILYLKYTDDKIELLRLIDKYESSFKYFKKEYAILQRMKNELEEDLNICNSKINF